MDRLAIGLAFVFVVLLAPAGWTQTPWGGDLQVLPQGAQPRLLAMRFESVLPSGTAFKSGLDYGLARHTVGREFGINHEQVRPSVDGFAEISTQLTIDALSVSPALKWAVREEARQRNESNRLGMAIAHDRWSIDLHATTDAVTGLNRSMQNTQSLAWSVHLAPNVLLIPNYSTKSTLIGENYQTDEQTSGLSFALSADAGYFQAVNVNLRYREVSGHDQDSRQWLADLGIRKKIRLPGSDRPLTSLDAAFTYRLEDNQSGYSARDDVGVRLTLQRTIGGS